MTTTIKYGKAPSTVAELDSLIKSVATSAHKVKTAIQECAVYILMHAERHGDYTKAQALVDQLDGTGQRRDSLVQYFIKFGGLTVGKNEEGEAGFNGWQGAEYIRANFAEAKLTYWTDVKVEAKPFAGFDFDAELNKLLARYENMRKKMEKLSAEDQAKVSLMVSGGTLAKLNSLHKFETIDSDPVHAEIAEALRQAM